jgi:hypothetical protein
VRSGVDGRRRLRVLGAVVLRDDEQSDDDEEEIRDSDIVVRPLVELYTCGWLMVADLAGVGGSAMWLGGWGWPRVKCVESHKSRYLWHKFKRRSNFSAQTRRVHHVLHISRD